MFFIIYKNKRGNDQKHQNALDNKVEILINHKQILNKTIKNLIKTSTGKIIKKIMNNFHQLLKDFLLNKLLKNLKQV